MRKTIVVPAPVTIDLSSSGGEKEYVFRFEQFFLGRMNDPVWGRSFDLLQARDEVVKAFRSRSPEGIFSIRRSDWETLEACCRNPTQPYLPAVMGPAMSFITAILDAKDDETV